MGRSLQRSRVVRPWHLVAAASTVLAAPAFFVFEIPQLGLLLLVCGLVIAFFADRRAGVSPFTRGSGEPRRSATGAVLIEPSEAQQTTRVPAVEESNAGSLSIESQASQASQASLMRDLSLIAIGLLIVRTISLAAELGNIAMLKFTLALGGAVLVPYLVSRFLYRDRATAFPWRAGARWGRWHWAWLAAVLLLGWLLLPFYFISSGVYQNWPVVDSTELIARLFVGVGAVGIWDELFFICTVFAVLLRHFPDWLANLLQSVVFVSFLWELGYRAWGPLLTLPFALVQGFIFLRTRSLWYVVTVHLLFDAVVFAVLVHAHNPQLFDIFPTAP